MNRLTQRLSSTSQQNGSLDYITVITKKFKYKLIYASFVAPKLNSFACVLPGRVHVVSRTAILITDFNSDSTFFRGLERFFNWTIH